jgi:hypothetical protein
MLLNIPVDEGGFARRMITYKWDKKYKQTAFT